MAIKRSYFVSLFEGYQVAEVKLQALRKGLASAVLVFDNGKILPIAYFERVPAADERWRVVGGPEGRKLKRGWRLDEAINLFYENKDAKIAAVKNSHYSEALKYDLVERLEGRIAGAA
jgi:hypothetical protein